MALRGLCLILCLSLFGCMAPLYNKRQVAGRFQATFSCREADVTPQMGGGYVVRGCGRVAHYTCIDPTSNRQLPGTISNLHNGTCLLEYVEEPTKLPAAAPGVAKHEDDGQQVLHTAVLIRGGVLRARAVPARDTEHVLLSVHSTEHASQGECSAHVYHDGVSQPVLQVERVNEHEARMALPISNLSGMGQTLRFAGDVCGLSFDLDEGGRKALGLLEVRFREELARSAGGDKI